MAAPVVSGIAALLRSFYHERDVYSSRYLMAQIAGSPVRPPEVRPGLPAPVVDAFVALTKPPTPGVTMLENWLFDTESIAPNNDGDGRIDSGETVHIGIELINRAGLADQVTSTLTAAAYDQDSDSYQWLDGSPVDFNHLGGHVASVNGKVVARFPLSNPYSSTEAPPIPSPLSAPAR